MLARRFKISEKTFDFEGCSLQDAIRKCLTYKNITSTIDSLANNLEYRQYRYFDDSPIVPHAVAAFLRGGETAAETSISQQSEHLNHKDDLEGEIKRSREFSIILDAICDHLSSRFPSTSSSIAQEATMTIVDAIVSSVFSKDNSTPMDALAGSTVLVSYVPGLNENSCLQNYNTSHWPQGGSSNSLTIKPNEAFATFLRMVNISSSAWIDAVEAIHSVRVDEPSHDDDNDWELERYQSWSAFDITEDGNRSSLVDVFELVDAVDNCRDGFVPMIAFECDTGYLLNRDWSVPIEISGGILGLHNQEHGSGNPIRFEQTTVINASKASLVVMEGIENDILSVHAFTRQGFMSSQRDLTHDSAFTY